MKYRTKKLQKIFFVCIYTVMASDEGLESGLGLGTGLANFQSLGLGLGLSLLLGVSVLVS